MLPSDHVIEFGSIADVYHVHEMNSLPLTRVVFVSNWEEYSPERVVERISSFPQHVSFIGNPLQQGHEFLRLTLVELTNRGHIVTITGNGSKMIPWKLIMPGVRYDLMHLTEFHNDNYRKLSEHDRVSFVYTNRYQWEEILKELDYARKEWNPACKFRIVTTQGMMDHLRYQIASHKLEVEIGKTTV